MKDFQAHLNNLDKQSHQWTIVSRQSARLKQLWIETHPDEEYRDNFIEGSLSGGWVLSLGEKETHHFLTDSEIFGWSRPQPRRLPPVTREAPEMVFADLKPGDYVVHVDHGIGQFIGLHKPNIDGNQREYLSIQYKNNDVLYVPPIHQADRVSLYVGPDGSPPNFNNLSANDWEQTKAKFAMLSSRLPPTFWSFTPNVSWPRGGTRSSLIQTGSASWKLLFRTLKRPINYSPSNRSRPIWNLRAPPWIASYAAMSVTARPK